MDIGKFIVGVLTIAIGLWAAGKLAPSVIEIGRCAANATQYHNQLKLGELNRGLSK